MATFTEHYDFIKPGTDDYYDVADFNENMDAIDTQLYQAEQDMAGVSEKIGNPGDEGTDTIFGLLHPNNQPEEKADFYRYSKTDIKKRITDWVILSGSHDTDFNAKLTTLHAEKNGTVYVKIRSRDQGIVSFAVYDKSDFVLANAPDQSKLDTSFYPSISKEYLYFTIEYNNNYDPTTVEKEWIFPVTAGHDYTFLYFGNSTTEAKLLEFLLGYTDTKEA